MERTGGIIASRVRLPLGGAAGPLEVVGVVAGSVLVWLLALGWDWTLVPGARPGSTVDPQTGLDWVLFGLGAMLGVGWLALRGRAVLGTVAVCLPSILLSGWRMAAAGVIGWPTGLASLVFSMSATCMVTALVGAWLRRRNEVRPGGR